MKVQDVWVQNGRKENPRQEEIERTTRLQIKTVTRTSKCRLTCIFAWQQPSKILLVTEFISQVKRSSSLFVLCVVLSLPL